jgi:hypothetical protein
VLKSGRKCGIIDEVPLFNLHLLEIVMDTLGLSTKIGLGDGIVVDDDGVEVDLGEGIVVKDDGSVDLGDGIVVE